MNGYMRGDAATVNGRQTREATVPNERSREWVFLSFVHHYAHFEEIVGGEQVRPYELFNALADMGHDVHVYERHNHDGDARKYGRLHVRPLPLPSAGVVRRILFWPVLYAVFFLELLRARRSGARLCLYQTLPWGARDVRRLELLPAFVLFWLAGRVGATTWGALHDLPLDHFEYGRTLDEQAEAQASEGRLARRAADVQMRQVRHADFVTVVSEVMRRAVVARSGVDPSRVAVFRSAVNPRHMEAIPEWEPPGASGQPSETSGRLPESAGRPSDRSPGRPWRIGFLGHAADAHLPLLIDAIEGLTDEGLTERIDADIELVLAGRGTPEFTDRDDVTCLGGVTYSDFAVFARDIDVWVIPYRTPLGYIDVAWQLKAPMYVGSGRPVVMTETAETPHSGLEPFLFTCGSTPDSIADRIVSILRDTESAKRRAESGRAHLLRDGTWRREAERLVERLAGHVDERLDGHVVGRSGGRCPDDSTNDSTPAPDHVALVTPTHLARNPRLVKEADALTAAGCEVDVFYCRFMPEVVEHDDRIVARAAWRAHAVSYIREEAPLTFWWSRLRQHICRRLFERFGRRTPDWMTARAYERIYPELLRLVRVHAAKQRAANVSAPDLYIAHNLQALPVALRAGRRHGARVGFDAEDFHTGMYLERDLHSLDRRLVVQVEERGIRACDYVTAAAPYIAEAYERRYEIDRPETVLNTFPSSMRPTALRPTDPEAPLTLYWFSQTIGPVRGLEDAAIAMAHLADLPVELHLRGQVTDPAYIDYLRKLAGDAADRIVLHDLAPAGEMIRLAAHHDVGLALETPVQHNRDICLSNKIFSYLAAGNAVLASGTTAQKALMERLGPVGAVYSPGNGREMALLVRQWHESRELLSDRRHNAWRAATDRFNWEYEQDVFLRVITRLFDERRDGDIRRSSAA